MITKIANMLTNFLVHRDIINKEEATIYVYGYEALLATVVNLINIFTIGFIFKQGWKSILFFMVFALTRVYSGGYHAHSYLKCNVVLGITYISTIVLNSSFSLSYIHYPVLLLVLFYLAVILKFAPVPNSKKKVDKAERIKFREKILLLSAVWTVLEIVFYFVNFEIALYVAITLFVVAVLIVIQCLLGREEVIHNEESIKRCS